MAYTPHTEAQRQEMLQTIGVGSLADLFHDVPAAFRFPALRLPKPASEMDILRELHEISSWNISAADYTSLLGAGLYNHFVPSVVSAVVGRSEFYTAYTPYQPEISQGTLQALFEYQSMICALTGMEVANASHYDGGTAVAEAAIMAYNILRGKRSQVLVSPNVHPEYRQVTRTYLQGTGIELGGDEHLANDLDTLEGMVGPETCCLIVQTPTFFGEVLDPRRLRRLADAVHAAGAVLVVAVDPISLGLFVPPGEVGADVVVGEGQGMGNAMNFGGPILGFFACRKANVRRMAGRLAGQTVDVEGKRGYVLTLSTREQHIRREKATSNICTNQALNALAAAVYLAAMGKGGLRCIAEVCYQRAHYAAGQIARLPGFELLSTGVFFKEFVVRCPIAVEELNHRLLENGFIGGFDLQRAYPHLQNCTLLCITERVPVAEIDRLVRVLQEVTR